MTGAITWDAGKKTWMHLTEGLKNISVEALM